MPTMKAYIAFGPRSRDPITMPPELAKAREAAWESVRALYRMAMFGENREMAVEQLAEIGALAAGFLETQWGNERSKATVESVAARRSDFPLLLTGVGVIGYENRMKMRESLPLVGTGQVWGNESADERDLGREILWFFMGVRNPGWLRLVEDSGERDVIGQMTRDQLRRSGGKTPLKEWTHAFSDYVTTYRTDLLSADGTKGRFSALAELKMSTYRVKNPRSAFFRFVRDRFRTVLKRR
jgi:hypothetical protein